MRTNSISVIAIFALCVATAPARAADQLLAQFTMYESLNSRTATDSNSLMYSINIAASSSIPFGWGVERSAADVGTTIDYPAEFVSKLDDLIEHPGIEITSSARLANCGGCSASYYTPNFASFQTYDFQSLFGHIDMHMFYPQSQWREIKALTLSVDELTIAHTNLPFPIGPDTFHSSVMRTSVYGVAVPEPASAAFVLSSLIAGGMVRCGLRRKSLVD